MMIDSPPIPEEEDYRVKNAREGRAIYVPGNSVAETRAKLGLPPIEDDPLSGFFNWQPNSFNDLLTLFEGYLDTLIMPLAETVAKLESQCEIDRGEITLLLLRHSKGASSMAKKLQDIRQLHNAGGDVTITLDDEEATRIELATAEVPYLLGHAEGIFGLLYRGMSGGYLSDEPGLISLLEISHRAFKAAAADEGETVAILDEKLRRSIRQKADVKLIRETASPQADALQ